ncbi:MAG: hypothetical protein KHX03_07510 [Clostridium sp.]|nr:hypothetical protein [Clostridium sp.]
MVVNPFEFIKKASQTTGSSTSDVNSTKKETDVSMWGVEIKQDIKITKDTSPKEANAQLEGYEKTANPNIYFDPKKNVYYLWNEKQSKFIKQKKIVSVLDTGYSQTKDGSFLDKDGNLFVKKEKTYYWPQKDIGYKLPYEMAKIYGLERTYKEFLFYDKENKVYKTWNDKAQKFVQSDIVDITKDQLYQRGEKYFDYWGKEVTKKDFIASKNNYRTSNDPDIFFHPTDDKLMYRWNEEKKIFEECGPNFEMKKLLGQKSDGKISSAEQGDIGDCWLIASVIGIAEFKPDILKECIKVDEGGNTTVNLKGPKKSYTITKDELDEAIKKQMYATGDRDMVAVELAFEKFRKENIETHKSTSRNALSMYYMSGYSNYTYLDGGTTRSAIETITGKKVTSLIVTNDENVFLEENVKKLGKLDENRIKKYLDNKNLLVMASLAGEDRNNEDAHAFVVKSYDENNVYLINPYDTSQTESMPKEKFYQKLLVLNYTDLTKPIDSKLANSKYITIIESPEVKKYKATKDKE